jgi:carbamoyl-phosphate synthase large subunit
MEEIVEEEKELMTLSSDVVRFIKTEEKNSSQQKKLARKIKEAKQYGFSDYQLAKMWGLEELVVRDFRKKVGVFPTYLLVDTCAAEFEAYTPYYYSAYENENEVTDSKKKKIVILGSGPNRIGQGIEFDYCCVHASFALREEGFETIMINCNPETVSTDYDTSDRLYFEPLTFEDVMNVIEYEKPFGVIVQFGGQTPLKLAMRLYNAGVNILGTSPDSIDIAEDRKRFGIILNSLNIPQPENGTALTIEEAKVIADRIGYPLLVRPSYVLGGRAMVIVYNEENLISYAENAFKVSPGFPVLIDKFLEQATEVDVDAVFDGEEIFIGGIMEHIEEAGIHSGDSACVIPPFALSKEIIGTIKEYTLKIAKALKVIGLINIQYAVKNSSVYILEANPRASRTVPFVSKSIKVPLAKIAALIMSGKKLKDIDFKRVDSNNLDYFSIKEAVLPFSRFPGTDIILGPEMKSTGEVMGIDKNFGVAFAKSQLAVNQKFPRSGTIFISVKDKDKNDIASLAKKIVNLGFNIITTKGTGDFFEKMGIKCDKVLKIREGRPNVLDLLKNGEIDLVINTPEGSEARSDGYYLRTAASMHNVPCITTISGASAAINGIYELKINSDINVKAIQDY